MICGCVATKSGALSKNFFTWGLRSSTAAAARGSLEIGSAPSGPHGGDCGFALHYRSAGSGRGLRFRERVSTESRDQSFGGRVWPVSLREVGADVAGGLGVDLEIAHIRAAGEGEAGHEGDADPGADEGAHEAVVAGAAGDTGMEATDSSEHVEDAADLAPSVDPAFAGEFGQADGWPVGQRVARG